ncbi:MAG: hypothetical protein ABIJ09_10890 [Pseudomonadota bacterium]
MRRLAWLAGLLMTTGFLGCGDCGGEPPPSQSDAASRDRIGVDTTGTDGTALDAPAQDSAVLDSSAPDAVGADSSQPDGGRLDATSSDGAVADAGNLDAALTDLFVADATQPDTSIGDAGTPVTVNLSIKVDELGTSDVSEVRVAFVRFDWDWANGPVVCEDGGVGDASGIDGGGPGQTWRTDTVGIPAHLASVSRSVVHFTVDVPESPPANQIVSTPGNPCQVNGDSRAAMYLPFAFLDSSTGIPDRFDDSDDIIGMGDLLSYASGTGEGHLMLVYAEGTALPLGLDTGWNLLVVGLYDNAPAGEPRALGDEIALAITATPHLTLDVSGQFLQPTGQPATTNVQRRVALLANRALGGVSEIVSVAATGGTYALSLPDHLNTGSLDDFIMHYGPLDVATGSLVTYLDANSNSAYAFSEHESSGDESCPMRGVWYIASPLPWPWALITKVKLARGYNVVGRAWNSEDLQVAPLVDLSETAPIDIDIPVHPDRAFTDNPEPTADTGCACGVIPVPYQSGCQ